MRYRRSVGVAMAAGFLAAVIAANWLTTNYGFVGVGFGYTATAGTFAAGFALALRDATQDTLGRWPMFATLAVGAGVSYFVADPHIAVASAVAFAVSELLDWAVYTPIRRGSRLGGKRWAAGVAASGAVGAVVDTVVFLSIAFGWAAVLPAMVGQLIGKTWATLVYLLLGKVGSVVFRQPDEQSISS